MQVKWLQKALQNLDDEAEYIAKENPAAAKLVVQRVFEAVNLLPANPAMGNPGRIYGTRELVVPDTRYILPYRVRPRLNRIEILRVFHTSRRLPKHW
ncbi:type II toxin-antitoxin system RelE/ParE family toxin [Gilvimarinus sp. SDUM040013]|uniref:Type II toxin-antitoxin system RelE/ParE family toxin n=1 Tax=Gilvimarinus gilvus TaxID=3058038 RepID=A0ABU4S372_9GAMM|nr:type II toxin-antitoxin system RelE/ParE family toxin [Gilvimarinus sp. SDUM040013]MDO3387528.1 type II toxin-antitoxin system RelE/ParE family toxin [Gilvimarinus sp. SDUM040013]MDX6851542.1 type II toxin-antitoxin system RelE/ParE family toxin [Gilvimarinus sp. SDUM040013]